VSVSQEIRRFQEEIDKVQQENTSFYRWKLRRATTAPRPRVRTILTSAVSTESLLSSAHGKKGKGNKKVSYCEAVTVFGSSESLVQCVNVKYDMNNNDGGITPTLHCGPKPQEEELVLPSVKKIATLFCRPAPAEPEHRHTDKLQHQNKPTAICPQPSSSEAEYEEPVPAMLTVRGQSCTSSQIHSITARTVPLEFRENLRRGKPGLADSILRLQDSPEH